MVSEYNTSARNQGIPESEMEAFVGNLIDAKDPNPPSLQREQFFDFDIAVVGLGFHHFDDPALAAKRLTERLKKGGVLMIVDFLPHAHDGHHAHAAAHTVTHMGFSDEQVGKMFEDAGAGGDFDYTVVGKGIVFHGQKGSGEDMKRSVFMARGTKV
jgi:SAM-dependent methyltransferase